MKKMKKVNLVPLLLIFTCLTFENCKKNADFNKIVDSQNDSLQATKHQLNQNRTMPLLTDPAVLVKNGDVWQCWWNNYNMQWPINTNFIYSLSGPTGSHVGAPVPILIGASNYSVTYSGGAPNINYAIIQWYTKTACFLQIDDSLNRYFNATSAYIDFLVTGKNSVNKPQFPDFQCDGNGMPVNHTFTFKLVIYGFDGFCNPIFAVTTIDWKPTQPAGCV